MDSWRPLYRSFSMHSNQNAIQYPSLVKSLSTFLLRNVAAAWAAYPQGELACSKSQSSIRWTLDTSATAIPHMGVNHRRVNVCVPAQCFLAVLMSWKSFYCGLGADSPALLY